MPYNNRYVSSCEIIPATLGCFPLVAAAQSRQDAPGG
jgi:hypothetical protein